MSDSSQQVGFGRKSQSEWRSMDTEYGFHMSQEMSIRRINFIASHEG
jgi:hypothetical protein